AGHSRRTKDGGAPSAPPEPQCLATGPAAARGAAPHPPRAAEPRRGAAAADRARRRLQCQDALRHRRARLGARPALRRLAARGDPL
ncbi:MAG: hypothetical protein AVDCRST_MAG27-181, partial [uncultured Craurococcus sp.]